MYAKGGIGVRIGMDKDCIDWDKHPLHYSTISDRGSRPPRKPNSSIIKFIQYKPLSVYGHINTTQCFHSVKYIKGSMNNDDITLGADYTVVNKTMSPKYFKKYIALYKDRKWAFQKEIRFRLFAVPQISKGKEMSFDEFKEIIAKEIPNTFTHIDLPLKETAFENLEITLGPNATESAYILVRLLRNEFAPSAKIIKSALNNNTWFGE